MFLSLYNQKFKVFLASCTGDVSGARNTLGTVLKKAGIEVAYPSGGESDRELMLECSCSVHVLGALDVYGGSPESSASEAGLHYRLARGAGKEGFRVFLWNPSGEITSRNQYVNSLRRDIVENTVYSAATSPILFVEDLRSIMSVAPKAASKLSGADIFFIYSDLDKESASDVLSMLQDLHKVASLQVGVSSSTDYSEYICSQLKVCRICVIYSDYAIDWALPFARQLWKDNGGQSARVPLYFAGNSSHTSHDGLKPLKGLMEHTVADKSLIPLDIKIFYDKITQNS